jgi:hypothetical protein
VWSGFVSCHHATRRESCKGTHHIRIIRSKERQAHGVNSTLLEDLAVSKLHGLAVDDNGLVPCPHVVDELLVLGLSGVELGEVV